MRFLTMKMELVNVFVTPKISQNRRDKMPQTPLSCRKEQWRNVGEDGDKMGSRKAGHPRLVTLWEEKSWAIETDAELPRSVISQKERELCFPPDFINSYKLCTNMLLFRDFLLKFVVICNLTLPPWLFLSSLSTHWHLFPAPSILLN